VPRRGSASLTNSLGYYFENRAEESIRFSIVNRSDRTLSISGRQLFADPNSGNREKFGVRLNAGTYFLRIKTSEGNNERYIFRLRINSRRSDD